MKYVSTATTAIAIEWYSVMMRPSRSAGLSWMPSRRTVTSRTPHSTIGPESVPQMAVTSAIIAIPTSASPRVEPKR